MNTSFSARQGLWYAFIAAVISGFAVFINKFGVSLWASGSVYTTAKNIVAGLILTGAIIGVGRIAELRTFSRATWIRLLAIALIGGSVPFALFFSSLKLVSVTEAAFIHKTLFLWVALLAYPFLKERLRGVQIVALAILAYGAVLLGTPLSWTFGAGAAMALAATMLWAVENIIAKIALRNVSSLTLAWARMFFGSLFLLAYLMVTGKATQLIPASLAQFGWAAATGAVLFAYVIFWYAALKRAPATMVTSVLVLAAPITAILNSFAVGRAPMGALVPTLVMATGIALLLFYFVRTSSSFFSRNAVHA